MILEPLRPGLIAHVAYNLRARDREEFAALGLVFCLGADAPHCSVPLPLPTTQSVPGHGWSGEEAGCNSTTTTSQLAERLALARYGFVACAGDGTPIAVCAGNEHLPGLVGWSFFATARLNEIGLALTRYLRCTFIPTLCEAGVRRAEARSLKGYDWAARWMRSLGFRDLCVLKRFGAGGQDFILWELTDNDVLRRPEPTRAAAPSAAPDDRQRGCARD